MKNKKGFTLVELLAVVVVISIILVMGVPKITSVIDASKRKTLESSARNILRSVEDEYLRLSTMGKNELMDCSDVSKIDMKHFENCKIEVKNKIVTLTLDGKNKFSGYHICNATKDSIIVSKGDSCNETVYNITYELNGGSYNESVCSDTLTWDGNIVGLENLENTLYKVSDAVVTEDVLQNGYTLTATTSTGETQSVSQDMIPYEKISDDIIAIGENIVYFITNDIVSDGVTLTKGVYFYKSEDSWLSKLKINSYSGFCIGGIEVSDTLKYDGNPIGLENIVVDAENSLVLYKISDVVVTEDMLQNGYTITVANASGEIGTGNHTIAPYEKMSEDVISIGGGYIYFVANDTEIAGMQLTKGIYSMSDGVSWVSGFKIAGQEIFENNNKSVKLKGDTITWNGNGVGLTNIENMLYKVSNAVITEDMLQNGYTLSVFTQGDGYQLLTQDDISYEKISDDMISIELLLLVSKDTELDGISLKKGIYFSKMSEEDMHFYISGLQINGYTGFVNNPDKYREADGTLTLIEPTKSGYEFIGWTGSNGDVPELNVTIPSGSTGDKYFVANWERPKLAQAIYSETDNSLTFIKRGAYYEKGDTFTDKDGVEKIVTAVYTDFETASYSFELLPLWFSYKENITNVVVEDEISPISTAFWFSQLENCSLFNLEKLNTSKVTSMSQMFLKAGYNTSTFEIIGIDKWNTSNVTNISGMFASAGYNASSFEIDLSNWNTSNVTDMKSLFGDLDTYPTAGSATTWSIGDLSNWDTSNVTRMDNMFNSICGDASICDIGDLSNWDVSNVTNMSSMFAYAGTKVTTFNIGDLSNWDISNVTDMSGMFSGTARNATTFELNLSGWDFSNSSVIYNMPHMFASTGFSYLNLSNWNVSNITDMNYMFYMAGSKATNFKLDLRGWDTSNVTRMDNMFDNIGVEAKTFEILGLDEWDTSNVTMMYGMFRNAGNKATTFNIGDLSKWNTSNVTYMSNMFEKAGENASYTQDLTTKSITREDGTTYTAWDVSKVTSYTDFNLGVESKVIAPTFGTSS